MADSDNEYPTVLGADAVFQGQLKFDKGARVLGKFEGEITSEGQLLIAEGSKLKGSVKAGSVRIEGQVKGNLTVSAKVQLASSARLEGDVQASRLEVAEGAVLIGQCVVGVNGAGKDQPQAKTASASAASVTPSKSKGSPVEVGAKR